MSEDTIWNKFDKLFKEAENMFNTAFTSMKVNVTEQKQVNASDLEEMRKKYRGDVSDFDELRKKYDALKKHATSLELQNKDLIEKLNAFEDAPDSQVLPFIKVAIEKVIAILQLLLKRL